MSPSVRCFDRDLGCTGQVQNLKSFMNPALLNGEVGKFLPKDSLTSRRLSEMGAGNGNGSCEALTGTPLARTPVRGMTLKGSSSPATDGRAMMNTRRLLCGNP